MHSSTDEGAFASLHTTSTHAVSAKRKQEPSPVGFPLPSDSTYSWQGASSCGSHASCHTQTALIPPKKRARLPQQTSTASQQQQEQQEQEQRVPWGSSWGSSVSLRARLPPRFLALRIVVPILGDSWNGEHEEARSPSLEPSPVYLGNSKLPVEGWFQSCRGCGTWTACLLPIREREIPFCKRCQAQFEQLTSSSCRTSANGDDSLSDSAEDVQPAQDYWQAALIDVDESWRVAIDDQVATPA